MVWQPLELAGSLNCCQVAAKVSQKNERHMLEHLIKFLVNFPSQRNYHPSGPRMANVTQLNFGFLDTIAIFFYKVNIILLEIRAPHMTIIYWRFLNSKGHNPCQLFILVIIFGMPQLTLTASALRVGKIILIISSWPKNYTHPKFTSFSNIYIYIRF